jgi:hypothetical protein
VPEAKNSWCDKHKFFGGNATTCVPGAGTPLKRHVQALMDFPPPGDIKQLQRYVGLINFYRRFLPVITGTLKPLTDLLRGNPKTLEWSDKAEAAFTSGKKALANCTKLVHPTPGAVVSLAIDASDTHVGGVLQQLTHGSWLPLAFFSRKLSSPEMKYSTFDRELWSALAISASSLKVDLSVCLLITYHWLLLCTTCPHLGLLARCVSWHTYQNLQRI